MDVRIHRHQRLRAVIRYRDFIIGVTRALLLRLDLHTGEFLRAVVPAGLRNAFLHQRLHSGADIQLRLHHGLRAGVDPPRQNETGADGRRDQTHDGNGHDDLNQRETRRFLLSGLFHVSSFPMGQLKISVFPVEGTGTPGSS